MKNELYNDERAARELRSFAAKWHDERASSTIEESRVLAMMSNAACGYAIHHSDHGSQYTSITFGKRCEAAGVIPSMGSVGDCYDNAMCGSFNATLECEILVNHRFPTQRDAALAVFDFIDGWYNPNRRHSALGYISPAEYQRRKNAAA